MSNHATGIFMTAAVFEKLSSRIAPEVLAALREIAEQERRPFQSVIDEALRDYIVRRQKERPRKHAMAALSASIEEFDDLYRELAR
jgi:predicted transcriptional regulator